MSTAGTITHRTPLTGTNNPAYQASKTWANDSLVIASAAPNGAVLVRDSGQTDGWGFDTGAAAGTLTGATLAANVLASSLTSLGTLSALAVSGAAPLFTRDTLAVTSTDGLVLQNTTAATAGVPVQQSPRLRLRSNVWNTTTPANNTDDWFIEAVPVSGATPSGLLKIGKSLNGGAVTYPLLLDSVGSLSVPTTVSAFKVSVTEVAAAAAGFMYWTGRAVLASPANAQLNLTNSATTVGVGLDVGVDAVLKIRTRAQTGNAAIWAGADGIVVTSSDGHVLANDTAASAGVPVQQSPRLRLRSHVWNTTTPADNTDDWLMESVPVSGATPTGLLKFGKSLNGGATTFPLTLTSVGTLTVLGNVFAGSGAGIFASSTGELGFSTRISLWAPASGQFNVGVSNQTAGVGLDVATDAVLKIRTRAQTADAAITAGDVTASNNVLVAGRLWFGTGTTSQILSTVDAQLVLRNSAQNAGVGLDVATDTVMKVRTRAHSAYATVDALGYSVSGVAGASKAAGPVTSITVVNGIVTACT